MTIDWQNTLAVGVVIVASVYVIWRLWRIGRGKRPPGCSTCRNCPTSSEPPQLVSLDPPPKK